MEAFEGLVPFSFLWGSETGCASNVHCGGTKSLVRSKRQSMLVNNEKLNSKIFLQKAYIF